MMEHLGQRVLVYLLEDLKHREQELKLLFYRLAVIVLKQLMV
jgi:hypothetical protein